MAIIMPNIRRFEGSGVDMPVGKLVLNEDEQFKKKKESLGHCFVVVTRFILPKIVAQNCQEKFQSSVC